MPLEICKISRSKRLYFTKGQNKILVMTTDKDYEKFVYIKE